MTVARGAAIESIRRVLRQEAMALQGMAEGLDEGLEEVVELLVACRGRVVCCGLGKSGHVAGKAAATFASTGTNAAFLHAAEALHGDLGMVAAGDAVLLYSYSGETEEIVKVAQAVAQMGAVAVAVTGRPDSSLGRACRLVVPVGVESEACPNGLAPTTSTTAMLAMSDALAVAAMETRGFGPHDFARYHPAGTLGRRLTLRVADVMRKGEDLPVVQTETPVLDLMRVISKTGAGGACVVDGSGGLVGYVSDGDLRRHFLAGHAQPLDATAQALMTTSPAILEPGLLAVEAIEFFQNHPKKIGEVPVVEDGRPIGLLVLKDLLRAGLI